MQSPERKQWLAAMDKEKQSLDENKVFNMVPLPQGFKIVGGRWVYAYKLDVFGNIISYKARLVAQGFTQRAGIDYDETYAPVARTNSSRLFLAYVNAKKFVLAQADVKTADLNGEMMQEVYMLVPKGFDNPKGHVFRIRKSLYGLKQSAHAWNQRINKDLQAMGFEPLGCEPCVYVRKDDGSVIILYVDDLGIGAATKEVVDEIFAELNRKFKCEMIGDFTDTQ